MALTPSYVVKLHLVFSSNSLSKTIGVVNTSSKIKMNGFFKLEDKELQDQCAMVLSNVCYHRSTSNEHLFLLVNYIEQLKEARVAAP